jgi:hypothetical protein
MYVGNETWLNPMAFGSTPVTSSLDPRYGLQPPFNKIASRREPGKVNINTLSLKPTWDALFHGSTKPDGSDPGHPGPDDDELWPVRRGYDGIDPATGAPYLDSGVRTNPTLLDQNVPSLFSNPYRSNSAGSLVPLPQMRRIGDVGAGLARPLYLPKVSQMGGALNPDVLNPMSTELQPKDVPFTATTAQQAYRNSFRNPYFRYSPISRLSSMTTTRSNVFAIWVTVGFFEVREINQAEDGGPNGILSHFGTGAGTMADAIADPLFQRVYPDGYTFEKEAGIETGEVERIREFAIVDRTIPVAFEPGANHNIGEMIRLRRKIKTE